MDIPLIHTHWATHHDQQIGRAKIERAEISVVDVDAIERVVGRLDRFAIPCQSLVGDMTNNESLFGRSGRRLYSWGR